MPLSDIVHPEDLDQPTLRSFYDDAELKTSIDSDGDLLVSRGVTCYAIPTKDKCRLLLLAFVGAREGAERNEKLEFANRVNNETSTIRARVNPKESIVFDYHVPIEGGVSGKAIVAATEFFLLAAAHAVDQCDETGVVR